MFAAEDVTPAVRTCLTDVSPEAAAGESTALRKSACTPEALRSRVRTFFARRGGPTTTAALARKMAARAVGTA